MKFRAIAAISLLVACTSGAQLPVVRDPVTVTVSITPVYIDDRFDDYDFAQIESAIEAWNQLGLNFAPRRSSMTVADMNDPVGILIMKVDSNYSFIPPTSEGNILAWTDQRGGHKVWLIRDRFGTEDVRPITMHELGHVLGAEDRDRSGLMYRHYIASEYRCIDAETVSELGLKKIGCR